MDREPRDSEEKVAKFFIMASACLIVLAVAMISVGIAYSAPNNGTVWFRVPQNVEAIRVRSYANGKLVMDRTLDVVPGQTFRVDPQ